MKTIKFNSGIFVMWICIFPSYIFGANIDRSDPPITENDRKTGRPVRVSVPNEFFLEAAVPYNAILIKEEDTVGSWTATLKIEGLTAVHCENYLKWRTGKSAKAKKKNKDSIPAGILTKNQIEIHILSRIAQTYWGKYTKTLTPTINCTIINEEELLLAKDDGKITLTLSIPKITQFQSLFLLTREEKKQKKLQKK